MLHIERRIRTLLCPHYQGRERQTRLLLRSICYERGRSVIPVRFVWNVCAMGIYRVSYFKNELVRARTDKQSHRFTLSYCPWSNGTVEVVFRELLRSMRALLSEFQLLPSVLPLVQSVLNNAPHGRLDNRWPLIYFTGLPQDSPFGICQFAFSRTFEVKTIEEVKARRIIGIFQVQMALDKMHKELTVIASEKRRKEVALHNARTRVSPINFTQGEFVLLGVFRKKRG